MISYFFFLNYIDRDDLSGLKCVELGAGLTIGDISVLHWTRIFPNRTATLTHQINVSDGMRTYIRLKATNNGNIFNFINITVHYHFNDIQRPVFPSIYPVNRYNRFIPSDSPYDYLEYTQIAWTVQMFGHFLEFILLSS